MRVLQMLTVSVCLILAGCAESPLSISSPGNTMSGDVSVRMAPPPGRTITSHGERCTGQPFKDLVFNPSQWTNARSCVDSFEYPGWILDQTSYFTADTLIAAFQEINSWDCAFCLGAYCLKGSLTPRYTAEESFYTWNLPQWQRLVAYGAQIDEFTIDESFTATRLPDWPADPQYAGDQYAVDETAQWIYLTRTQFASSTTRICSIESYPEYLSMEDIMWWVVELNAACADLGVSGIQELALDVNWNMIGGDWDEVVEIDNFCDSVGVDFSLIYWPAPHPFESGTDLNFFKDIMSQGADYMDAGGTPDIYAIESWNYIPRQMVPQTMPWSYTYSFQRFVNAYVPK